MRADWTLLTGPTTEPISVESARSRLRVVGSADDPEIIEMIRGVRSQAEEYLHRGLLTQTWKYQQDNWTDEIRLPMAAPLQSVASVKYFDDAGAQQTLATSVYQVELVPEPGFIALKPNQAWPTLQSIRALPIEIQYLAGWTEPSLVPGAFLHALFLLLGQRFRWRGDDDAHLVDASKRGALDNPGAEALLTPFRVWWREPVRA